MGIRYEQSARVHRFHGAVAMDTETGTTVYLTPKMAEDLARVLLACAQDIREVPKFHQSPFRTTTINESI